MTDMHDSRRDDASGAASVEECRKAAERCRTEIARRIVGQGQLVDGILMALIAGGHVLLEGVPGLAKTLTVKTFAEISGLDFKRIQFTPDLLPADLIGTLVYEQSSGTFSARKGPVFANLVLADEINRAPAKVQSALLEAMAERQVTIGDTTWPLPQPFFVLATQNPIEQEGTYNLPEAELDRFLMKLIVPYPTPQEEFRVVKNSDASAAESLERVFTAGTFAVFRRALEYVVCDDKIIEYIVSLTASTRPLPETRGTGTSVSARVNAAVRQQVQGRGRDDLLKYILFGASPRASLALYQCAKIAAVFAGRTFVLPEDVKAVAPQVMRHRLVLSYEAGADGLTSDDLIAKILSLVPVP